MCVLFSLILCMCGFSLNLILFSNISGYDIFDSYFFFVSWDNICSNILPMIYCNLKPFNEVILGLKYGIQCSFLCFLFTENEFRLIGNVFIQFFLFRLHHFYFMICERVCMYTCIYEYILINVYVVHVCIYIYVCNYMWLYTSVCICTCVYVCMVTGHINTDPTREIRIRSGSVLAAEPIHWQISRPAHGMVRRSVPVRAVKTRLRFFHMSVLFSFSS